MNCKPTLIIFLMCCISPIAFCQNIAIEVKGNVAIKNRDKQMPVKKGDDLADLTHLLFTPDARFPQPEIKLLTPKGIALIRYGDYQSHPQFELTQLIVSTIHHNSIITLGTRGIHINIPSKDQLMMVDSLCQKLNVTRDNVESIFSTYITPYCTSEFDKPYWIEIGQMLRDKYGLNFYSSTGSNITAAEYNAIPHVAQITTRDILPVVYSLKKYCPTPGFQGSYGSCVGWSSAYGVRTISWAIKNNDTVTSDITNQAFSPGYVYAQIKSSSDYNCQNGANIYDALELLKKKGVPFYSELGFKCGVNVMPFNTDASNYVIKDYYALTKSYGVEANDDAFNQNLLNIKRALAQKRPVLADIACYQSFAGKIWNGLRDVNRGSHAICIIGYNDNFADGDGAVEIMNSWGPWWGNNGFIYVKYKDLKNILHAALAMYDDVKAEPLNPPKPDKPKRDTLPVIKTDTLKHMEGSLSLTLKNNIEMPVQGVSGFRGLGLVTVDEMTYGVTTTYPTGTLFKINFTSNKPAYVYMIATDSKKSPLTQLFPDPESNTSALLDFNSTVAIAIPEGQEYIQMDETTGEDYLCIIYSKDQLDIAGIKRAVAANQGKSFVKTVKESLAGKIVDDSDIQFEKERVSFKAASRNKTIVPIFIKIKHG